MAVLYSRGGGSALSPVTGTTGGASISLTNNGVTVLNHSSADTFMLAPPEAGCRKTLICTSSSSVARVVRTTSGSGDQTITFGNQTATKLSFTTASTVDACVVLVGLSSVRWAVESAWPISSTSPGMVTASSG